MVYVHHHVLSGNSCLPLTIFPDMNTEMASYIMPVEN